MTFREIFYYLDCLHDKAAMASSTPASPEQNDEFGREAERFVLDPSLSW